MGTHPLVNMTNQGLGLPRHHVDSGGRGAIVKMTLVVASETAEPTAFSAHDITSVFGQQREVMPHSIDQVLGSEICSFDVPTCLLSCFSHVT